MPTKIKILLVEDDQAILEMYKMKFTEEGYDITAAEDGMTALEAAKKEIPKMVLLDIILPKLDGFSVLEELKKDPKTKNIPVLLLSNLGQDSDKEKGKKLGAVDYCVKSDLTPMQLVEKVRTYIK
ncbi:MAG: hypothetical protein US74_C0008G0003 [Parcubacteria group bacterium GW2011_GWA2_38_13]|nr:MAG: hypothetical protein US74_C0008G0003 [Parcubacteria group bacterium GW2011_GWA2_38_13]